MDSGLLFPCRIKVVISFSTSEFLYSEYCYSESASESSSSIQNRSDASASRKRKDFPDGAHVDLANGTDWETIDGASLPRRPRLEDSVPPIPQSFGKFYLWMADVLTRTRRHSMTPGVCAICLSHTIHRPMYRHVMSEHIHPAMDAVLHYRETPQELFILLYFVFIKSPTTRNKYPLFLSTNRDFLPNTGAEETLVSPRHDYPELYDIARSLSQATREARRKRWVCHCAARFGTLVKLQKHIMDEKEQNPSVRHFQRKVTFNDQRNGSHSTQMRVLHFSPTARSCN